MQKMSIIAGWLFVISGIITGCAGESGEKARQDSLRREDSIALVEAAADQAKVDSIINDSLLTEAAEKIYENAIVIKAGKKERNIVPESSFYKVEWRCMVVNNSGISLLPENYEILYDESFEDGNVDGLFEVTRQRKLMGKKLAPGDSIEVVLTGKSNTQDLSRPAVRFLISKEEFIRKYKEINKSLLYGR